MSRTATIKFNTVTQKFEAIYNNILICSGTSAGYVKAAILAGTSKKAIKFGVTAVYDESEAAPQIGTSSTYVAPKAPETVESMFKINERFAIMEDFVDMVAQKSLASALITGEGGLGKTYTVMATVKKNGLKDVSEMEIGAKFSGKDGYAVIKGYSTAKGLYRTLYENRGRLCIFDDCDSVLRDPVAANLLKAALDSYDKRVISWNAESFGDDDLPKQFEFTGGVIFISNMNKSKIPQAIRSRAMCADVSMSRGDVVERMRTIVQNPEFQPDVSTEMKLEAMDWIDENAFNPLIHELNLRSLVNTIKCRIAKPDSWKRASLYDMVNAG